MTDSLNPFEVTKAVDYTDDEIRSNFVDYPNGGFRAITTPRTPMPTFLVGGKGGGRTHLMRYYSYNLRRQMGDDPLSILARDGYLGIYFRCSGLNASRFQGKSVTEDAWKDTFNFYLDVWFTEHLLNVLVDMQLSGAAWETATVADYVADFRKLLPQSSSYQIDVREYGLTLESLQNNIVTIRKAMDRSINNAAIHGRVSIDILSNPGELIFSACRLASQKLAGLQDIYFTFLVDEFENLTEQQQVYFNTLVREKVLPTTFLIGSRQWGIRTQKTLSAGEENKRGSEYEEIVLESRYRDTKGSYSEFCLALASRRLEAAGVQMPDGVEFLKAIFPKISDPRFDQSDRFEDRVALELLAKVPPNRRPHLIKLAKNLELGRQAPAIRDEAVRLVSNPLSPMSEKLAIHRLYQSWSSSGHFELSMAVVASREIAALKSGRSNELDTFLNLWKNDLLAQVYLDCDRRSPYQGIDRFIEMSGYLPRSFLTILKYVTQASLRRGQFSLLNPEPVSAEAQMAGVLEASRWFLRDAKPIGVSGNNCDRSIRRLATLFNRLRYSDKPSEVSCVSFSSDLHALSAAGNEVLDACLSHGLLVEIDTGRKARNNGSKHRKFQLHPMLSPAYALPISRRGDLTLTRQELMAIFDPVVSEEAYAAAVRRRLSMVEAPFRDFTNEDHGTQDGLF